MVYGMKVPKGSYGVRGVLTPDGISAAGNVIVRAGRQNPGGAGWHQTEHVVCTPQEARDMAADLLEAAGEGEQVQIADAQAVAEDVGCPGHPEEPGTAGSRMGETVYCDGSCQQH